MLTSVCLCTYIPNQKRFDDLRRVLDSLHDQLVTPVEVVVVDDVSPMKEAVKAILEEFKDDMKADNNIDVWLHFNEENLKHAKSQNLSMQLAGGDVLIHIEDDIVVDYKGWNQVLAKCLQDHPEVGQVLPNGSGRGEWIPRPGYNEFAWGLGGLWAVRKEVFKAVGGWDETLVHQIEPDYNFRVRMAGWRVAQISDFAMGHLGEGDFTETFERQAQVHVGVYNFLKKWNRRFFGTYAYRDVWCMSPDDFPINVAFRRQLAAWYASEGKRLKRKDIEDSCTLNKNPQLFKYPGHWGEYELVRLIRPKGREREEELINLMGQNYVFKDVPEIHKQIFELAQRMNKPMTREEVDAYLKDKQVEYDWKYDATRY